ncbi:Ras-related protein Rab-44 [Larimichthys crocea]|uniref:Ras-related protein Rab-44 n=1 Tax=Larimichthys crocea TaxID=215358 RepID=A0A6G0J4T3_LARCR|nr:Ras-related protein Rab-44 [Larimichthys crocea]
MGSTRRTQLNREPEEGMGNEDENKESDSNMADMKFDRMEVVELPVIVTADVHQNGNTKLSPVDKEQQGTNVINTVQDLALTFLPPVDPTKENNFEALEQTNEEQQISGTERVDTALGQVYVIKGQVEDDIKPSVFSEEESNSSLQTLQSGTNATLDSQPEQNDTNFKPIESRRKLGSSRRNKGRHHAKDSEQQGTNEISTVQDLALMALPPEQSTVDVEPSQPDDFTSTEMHVPSVPAGTNTTNAGITGESFVSSYETTQSAQNDEKRLESVNLRQDQALKSAEADLEMMKSIVRGGAEDEHKDDQANIQELNDVNEGAHNTNLEMKNSSPNLNSPGRRRKMGSTRRNLGSRSKREDLHEQQEVENRTEATETLPNVGDVKSASFQSIEEKEELQPLTEDKEIDPEQRKEKVFETVEYSHAFESHVKPPPHQEIEENPVSHVQLVETDHLTPRDLPAIPSTSPTAGGRRRKLGSSRKLRGHQTEGEDTITDTQNRRDVRSITEESDIKTTEEDSLGLDKISEVDESDKEPPSNISASKEEELLSQPVSEETPQQVTPVTSTYAEIHLSQESQKTFSLAGSPKGAALISNSYNVMMVGDSSVGKSSFMKRAQSGKFSLDLPSSVGLDSCKWTVLVDGKPVVLHLWDTAGQERFHSITRQIFHKAQAFLLMYDITSTQSFSAVSYWADCIQEGAAENVTILLLGNKNDMAERKVKTEEGANLARECNFEFMECSAATGENVIHSLETVARMLSQKVDTREETTVLQKEPQQKKSGCC